jgi:uncharacterized protein
MQFLTDSHRLHTVYTVSGEDADLATAINLSKVLGREYWLIMSTPAGDTDRTAIDAHVREHVAWLLQLERENVLFVSGPLLSGPGVGPGSGVTVVRAADEEAARLIASADPFVRAGLRTFEVYRWRLNEGSVSISVSLGTGTYQWR